MDKTRIENLSDGIFGVAFTLLAIEIQVPQFFHTGVTNMELFQALYSITPLFVSYYVSFVVLIMFWIIHHSLFGVLGSNVNRKFTLMNFFYLCMIAFIPFSSKLIGTHPETQLAFVIYGLNVLAIGAVNLGMLLYAKHSNEIDTTRVSQRLFNQAHFRFAIIPVFTLIGIAAVFVNFTLALFLFAFPVLFNIIPGTLDYIERKCNLNFGEEKASS